MAELVLPHTFVAAQVIFGEPLKHLANFRVSDVAKLTAIDFNPSNTNRVVERLVELGWLAVSIQREENGRGRPATLLYARTAKGKREYTMLVSRLTKYGIALR